MKRIITPPDIDRNTARQVPLVSVVVPIYNEEGIVTENLATLARFFNALIGGQNWVFVLVENGSRDNTAALVDDAAKRWSGQAIHLQEANYGVALKTGLRAARTDWAFIIDLEQWDLPFLAWAWANREVYDILIASKRADPTICHQHYYRRVLSCGLNGLLQVFLQFTGTDTHGPKLVNRVSLAAIIEACELDRGQYDTELVLRAVRSQKRIVEVPFEYRELRPNRNWMAKKILWNCLALCQLIKVMKSVPHQGYTRYYRLGREDVLVAASRAVEQVER